MVGCVESAFSVTSPLTKDSQILKRTLTSLIIPVQPFVRPAFVPEGLFKDYFLFARDPGRIARRRSYDPLRIEFSIFSSVSQLARSSWRCTAEAGNQAFTVPQRIAFRLGAGFRSKQSKLENSFAAALFFQMPRARLQQIIERH